MGSNQAIFFKQTNKNQRIKRMQGGFRLMNKLNMKTNTLVFW